MDTIGFVNNYETYINEIRAVIKPEFISILDELAKTDPHDLVRPDTWFPDENSAKGFVWNMFIRRVKSS